MGRHLALTESVTYGENESCKMTPILACDASGW